MTIVAPMIPEITPEIILASSSRYRQQLLMQLGLTFRSVSPDVNEAPLQQRTDLTFSEKASQLAVLKAKAVQADFPEAILIGSDQVACLGNELLLKPGSYENNLQQLQQLSGKTHELITAVAVLYRETICLFENRSRMTMRQLTRPELERYIAHDTPWDCAGGYKVEGQGLALFEQIETADHSAIQGLPLIELVSVLRTLGIQIP